MTGSPPPDVDASSPGDGSRPRWPGVLGTIGIILGILVFLDQIDDFATLRWTAEDWRRVLAPDVAELVVRVMPSAGWRLLAAATETGLGALLMIGSIGLYRRRRSAIYLCRLWAWLAVGYSVLAIGWATWWLQRFAPDIPGLPQANWEGYAAFGVGLALVLMLAYPVFMLLWLAKPVVRAEYERWAV